MKKEFGLTITSTLALALVTAGCGPGAELQEYADRDTAICVDRQGNRVPDYNCNSRVRTGSVYYPYYVSRGGPIPYYGDSVRGERYRSYGSFRRTAGRSYFSAPSRMSITRSAAVSRGGFGSSARSGFSVSS